MSLVTLTNDNKLLDTIQKAFPELYGMIVLDKAGNLHSYFVSETCAGACDLPHLKEVAKLVSIRFGIGGFDKLAGGLDLTVNVFSKDLMLVRPISQDRILAIMIPRTDSNDIMKTVLDIDTSTSIIGTELAKVSSETTDFQKTTNRLQPKIYTIVSSPVNSGSFYPASKAYLNLKLGKNYRNINFDTEKND
ncbi:MAG: hypothetical protein O6761_04440 [Thaumarchaeota archaeon]|nr:hypothetical protein [Nitrososphaerota archaeon]